ncbi:MAG: hypothetical protein HKP61_13655 [Dactylosporangium sp.]|nr:hypothetical protein [Dactylosporangium sp.]NNJ61959.1 hypothetical protein [Dactylosporangium sp.]
MRHLGSLAAGLLIAPAAWLLVAIGQPRTVAIFNRWSDHDAYDTVDLIGPVAYLVAAGLLFGLVAALRLSPAGPLLAGVGYAAVYGIMFVDPLWGLDHIPSRIDLRWIEAEPRIPVVNGTLALLAAVLLVASFSRRRWHSWPSVAPAEAESTTEPAALPPAPLPLPAGTTDADVSAPEIPPPPAPEQRKPDDSGEPAPADPASGPAPEAPKTDGDHGASEPSATSPWAEPPRVEQS